MKKEFKINDLFINHRDELCTGAIIFIFFIFTMILNFHTDYTSDDFKYHFLYDTLHTPHEGTKRISSLWDVIISQINHWKICNGRVVAHGLLQTILPFGKVFFRIFNSLAYSALGFLVYKHASFKRSDPFLLCIIYILMWFFIPQYGLTVLWASGAANYLWCAAIILAYLLPYRKYALSDNGKPDDSTKNLVIMSVFRLFAGCTSENTGGGLVLMCMLFVILYKIKGLKIPRWSLAGILSSAAGAFVLISAPSSGNKLSGDLTLELISARIKDIFGISAELTYILLLIITVLLILMIVFKKADTLGGTNMLLPFVYIIGAYAMIGVLILSPQYPERSWFTPVICLIITAGMLFSCLRTGINGLFDAASVIAATAAFSIFIVSFSIVFKDVNKTYKTVKEGVDRIEQAIEQGKDEVTIPIVTPTDSKYDPFNGAGYVKKSADDWLNAWMAEYYGIDRINGQ